MKSNDTPKQPPKDDYELRKKNLETIRVRINGEIETLYGVEKIVYERGGPEAVIARRNYISEYNAEKRRRALDRPKYRH